MADEDRPDGEQTNTALVMGLENQQALAADYHHPAKCPVCTHPHKPLIEAMYLDVRGLDEIVGLFGKWDAQYEFEEKHLRLHADFSGLSKRRSLNDDGYLRAIKEKGLEVLGKKGFEVKPDLLFKALRHSDEKQGRMPQRTRDAGPRVTLVLKGNLPQLGGEMPSPDAIEAEFEDVEADVE